MPNVSLAGLQVPDTLIPRIVAACRGVYPTLTEGKTNTQAVLAVVKYWFSTTLAQWEGSQAQAPAQGAIDNIHAQYSQQAEQARTKATTDADAIQA